MYFAFSKIVADIAVEDILSRYDFLKLYAKSRVKKLTFLGEIS